MENPTKGVYANINGKTHKMCLCKYKWKTPQKVSMKI